MKLSDAELLANRAIQLERREEDLARIHKRVLAHRYKSITDFERGRKNNYHYYNFAPSEFVMVLSKKIKPDVRRKCRPRYFNPLVVAKWLRSGAYRLAEVNGALLKLDFAAFRVIRYRACLKKVVEVTEYVDEADLAGTEDD
ncbi:putative transposition, RNA-mediated [Lyophyllum shimeji]|uniref:Transposition, RNA-mediated n=1 Tax=Lyophyllum shimeji TaxID=47721 RepID=A0A9P3USI2_LYOSH|nr:putative transposition, RNA-mediated [Lyophyllum shimeji]